MRRMLALLALPLQITRPHGVGATGGTMTVLTKDRITGGPVAGACYSVADRVEGGGRASACDHHDGANDGTTLLSATDPCDSCRISQGLPDDPETDLPTDYLLEPPLDTGWGGTVTFQNYAKPYLVVSSVDARTGKVVPWSVSGSRTWTAAVPWPASATGRPATPTACATGC
jgi:hypothetical protein